MKKKRPAKLHRKKFFLPQSILVAIACFSLVAFFITYTAAQSIQFREEKDVTVKATVGSTTLTISGYQSPYSSIILKTSTGTFLSSTTADAKGYFSFTDVLINGSELTYCFQAVDFKRVGLSESCITIPGPIVGNIEYKDVFLPPTIGLSKTQIRAGQDAVIYGYSMPGATVILSIAGETVTVVADAGGFYSYTYKNVPAGKISITAKATLNDKPSLDPQNEVTLEATSLPEQITNIGKDIVTKVTEKAPFNIFNYWPYLLLALALLTAIGILLYKLKIGPWMILIDFLRRKKKMHHDWFLDKW